MTTPNTQTRTYAAHIGIDWADKRHAIALQAGGGEVEEGWLDSDPEKVHAWARALRERFGGGPVAIGLELSKGALIEELRGYEFIDIYPLNPAMTHSYRKAFTPSGAKDDMPDARLQLELVGDHRDKLRVLGPKAGADRRIELLAAGRRKLVGLKTKLCNTLRSTLKDYYPLALEVAGELGRPMGCQFLLKWPQLGELKAARRETVRAFYYASGARRAETIEGRLEKIAGAEPVSEDPDLLGPMAALAVALVGQIKGLNAAIDKFEGQLEEAYAAHPDREIWSSFPGAGAALAPRLAAAWGTDREAYSAADDMLLYSGIAPVTERSGNSCWVHRRYARPLFLHQSFWEYAKQSYLHCRWAKLFVDGQKAKGKKHSTAIRALAFKWIRIMFACWARGETYDEARYLQALRDNGSPLAAGLPDAT